MIKISIDNKSYELPERLTVDMWQRIVKWDIANEQLWPNIIGTATGAPVSQLAKATKESLELGIIFITALLQETKEAKIKDLSKMNFGQFIDLDIYLVDGIDKNLHKIANQFSDSVKWADEALYVAQKATEWRNHIYKEYTYLFGLDEAAAFTEEGEDYSANDLARNWYDVIYSLANDNILNIEPITELPLKQALNFMATRKQKIEKQIQEQKQRQRQLKLA